MRALAGFLLFFATVVSDVLAERWVEVGADPEAKFYVDVDSIAVVDDSLRVIRRGAIEHQ